MNTVIPVSERMARTVMKNYPPQRMEWRYEHGLVLQSIFLLGERTEQEEFCRYVQSVYDRLITPDGEILTYRESEYNLDQINPGKNLFSLYRKYGGDKYKIAIDKLMTQLRNHPRTAAGGFWHKQIYPWQMWLDGLYMQGPFYARYAAEFGSAADFDDVIHQFILIESKSRDSETGLLYHGWDESRMQLWSNPENGCSPHFWGRAMGWYCMALVDVLDFVPVSNRRQYESLAEIALRLIAPLLRYQDAQSGLWYQVLDRGHLANNYTESSASAMFVYFLLKLVRFGLVPANDAEQVKAAANKAYKGLLTHKIREEADGLLHLTGVCNVAGLGGQPYRDGSYEYYINEPVGVDDFKGVGAFILASMEYEGIY